VPERTEAASLSNAAKVGRAPASLLRLLALSERSESKGFPFGSPAVHADRVLSERTEAAA
jgi:hypothetical protein